MVVFVLSVKADLENVSVLKAPPLHQWCLDVKQSDGEETREGIFVSEEESHELTGSRGTAHCVLKFPGSKKESYLNVVRDLKKVIREYTANDSGQYVPIVAFDCRGLEPTKWYPESGYTVISAGGKEFTEVDLKEDWAEYDEDAGESVGVYGLEYKLEVHRG